MVAFYQFIRPIATLRANERPHEHHCRLRHCLGPNVGQIGTAWSLYHPKDGPTQRRWPLSIAQNVTNTSPVTVTWHTSHGHNVLCATMAPHVMGMDTFTDIHGQNMTTTNIDQFH